MIHYNSGFGTNIGLKRQQNQDSGAALPELGLFLVADGMGGHRGGETASALAVETITKVVTAEQKKSGWTPRETVDVAIRSANAAIFDHASKQTQLQGMGTTTTALLFTENKVTIGHVGDSRCYYFRKNALWQVTRDHSLVQEKLRAGLITREQLKTDRMKNVITRSVGFEPEVNVEIYEMEIKPEDVFLICSDGLSGLTDDRQIQQIVQKYVCDGNDVEKAIDQLIKAANSNGGDDNITVVTVKVMST